MLIPQQANIAKPAPADIRLSSYVGVLHRTLVQEFVTIYTILRELARRGVETPLVTTSYTVAELPTPVLGSLAIVSDELEGTVLAFADGTNWRRVTDREIVGVYVPVFAEAFTDAFRR